MKLHSSQGSHYSSSWKVKGHYFNHTNIHRMPRVMPITVYLRRMNTPEVVFVQLFTFYELHPGPTSRQSLRCPDPPDQSCVYHISLLPHSVFLLWISSLNTQEHFFSPFVFKLLPQLPQKYPLSLSFSCEPNNKPSLECWVLTIILWIKGKKNLRWWSKIRTTSAINLGKP